MKGALELTVEDVTPRMRAEVGKDLLTFLSGALLSVIVGLLFAPDPGGSAR